MSDGAQPAEEERLLTSGDALDDCEAGAAGGSKTKKPAARWAVAVLCVVVALLLACYWVTQPTVKVVTVQWRSLDDVRASLNPEGETSSRITIALMTEPGVMACRTLFSLLANGYAAPHMLHFSHTFQHGLGDKIVRYADFLRHTQLLDTDVVLLADGIDIWFQLPEHVLLRRFEELGAPTVFSAGKMCWPSEERTCGSFPNSSLPADIYSFKTDSNVDFFRYFRPRYVNSGFTIGRSKEMRTYIEEAMTHVDMREGVASNDQGIAAKILVKMMKEGGQGNFTLDYRQQLAQVMERSENEIAFKKTSQLPHQPGLQWNADGVADFYGDRKLAVNTIVRSIPVALHFNGDRKPLLWSWWRRMWFMQADVLSALLVIMQNDTRAGAWLNGTWTPFSDICGHERWQ